MSENPASCTHCGATFHESEFGVDHDGYLVCLHLCGRAAIERHRVTFKPGVRPAVPVPQRTPRYSRHCADCPTFVAPGLKRCARHARERRMRSVRAWYQNRNVQGKAS